MGNIPVTTTTKIFQKVLRYKWEAHCDTNGRSTDNIPLASERRGTKSTAVQIGGVLQYKWEVYCDTFLRSSGGWGFWHSKIAAQREITPPIAQCLFEIVLQRGVSHPFALFSQGLAPVSLRYPFWGGGGSRTSTSSWHALHGGRNTQKRGRGCRTQLAMLRHQKPP